MLGVMVGYLLPANVIFLLTSSCLAVFIAIFVSISRPRVDFFEGFKTCGEVGSGGSNEILGTVVGEFWELPLLLDRESGFFGGSYRGMVLLK